ncbi:MAG: DUF1641 domain-containing protein [Nitrospirae bacterium]|nr:DUF1641 domain-containing protein [Nitrospirota bacterium]
MANKTVPTNGTAAAATEQMAMQIDELYGKFKIIENFAGDVMPGMEKMMREINSTLNDLRIRFERDETLQLLKNIGDNIPTFIELLGVMKAFKGFTEDVFPASDKMMKELTPAINTLRYAFEKDETLQLLKNVGDNIPTFIELLKVMKAFKGFAEDVFPASDKMMKELTPAINTLRYAYEKDETLQLLKNVGDNIPTFIELLGVMKAFKGFAEDVFPASDKMMKELTPTINSLRYAYEKDETLELLQKTGDNIPTFIKLLDFLTVFDKSGDLDFTLATAFSKETEYMIKGMEKCAVRTMQQLIEKPLKPGFMNIFAALKDPEVQKGFVLMTTFARNMPQCMLETIEESGARIKKAKEE